MGTFTRQITINSNNTNGETSSTSWSTDPHVTHMRIANSDTLAIEVTDSGSATSMTAYAIISDAPGNSPNSKASPFAVGNQTRTLYTGSLAKQASGKWLFSGFPAVATSGRYELTYVIQTDNGNQFSEDPEFDVDL